MQFHPTALYAPQLKKNFLISEAVRGFGGILKNHEGKEFMNGVHPLRSLAPRDIVARAIQREMERTGESYMNLDVTHRSAKDIKTRFPNIYAKCLECGIDMAKDWIPVVPAAHYMCGGVRTDSWSRTSLPGLYACGEVAASGVHGANRLASNSLLESVVFALRACEDIQRHPPALYKAPKQKVPEISKENSAYWNRKKQEVQEIMWHHCGIVRSLALLTEGYCQLRKMEKECLDALSGKGPRPLGAYEFRNIVQSARLIVKNALLRKESRGLQCLLDHPKKDPRYLRHICVMKNP
jgi:L-aspartate oxidase